MMHRIAGTSSAAVVLLTTHMSAVSASAAPVNRPLADELTRQFNQKELEQLESGAAVYSQTDADQLNRQQLDQPVTAGRPTGISRAVNPSPPEWPRLPH
jgi:hypothetical protein